MVFFVFPLYLFRPNGSGKKGKLDCTVAIEKNPQQILKFVFIYHNVYGLHFYRGPSGVLHHCFYIVIGPQRDGIVLNNTFCMENLSNIYGTKTS